MTNARHKLVIPEISVCDAKRRIHFPEKIDENLAELVGIYLGDGHLAKRIYRNEYKLQITGHMVQDRFYYEKFVIPLIRNLFNIEPKLYFKPKENVFQLEVYSKGVFLFLVNNFDLPIGRKENIRIPEMFFKDPKLLGSCVRGVLDTDFYFSVHKSSVVFGAFFNQKSLVEDLETAFSQMGICCKTALNDAHFDKRTNKIYTGQRITVRKRQHIEKIFNEIGTHHPMMALKYKIWKNGEFVTSKDITSSKQNLLEEEARAFKFGSVYML